MCINKKICAHETYFYMKLEKNSVSMSTFVSMLYISDYIYIILKSINHSRFIGDEYILLISSDYNTYSKPTRLAMYTYAEWLIIDAA